MLASSLAEIENVTPVSEIQNGGPRTAESPSRQLYLARQQRYNASEKGRARSARYSISNKGRARSRDWWRLNK